MCWDYNRYLLYMHLYYQIHPFKYANHHYPRSIWTQGSWHPSQCSQDVQEIQWNAQYDPSQILLDSPNDQQGLQVLSLPQFKSMISHLTNNKSPGKSGLQFEVFKYSPDCIISFIHLYFQTAVQYGCIPTSWQLCLIHAIYKTGKPDPGDINDHCPISLSKWLRRLFTKSIIQSLVAKLPIDSYQFAYKRFHHSVFDLTNILNFQIQSFFAEFGEYSIIIQSDVKGAFDGMSRQFVLENTAPILLNKASLRLVHLLLDSCLQLRLKNVVSDVYDTTNGIIQGGTLSPILYIFAKHLCFQHREDSKNIQTAMPKFIEICNIWSTRAQTLNNTSNNLI